MVSRGDKNQLNSKYIILDYNRIYSDSGIRANSNYYRWLVGLLKPKLNKSILDVSCGEGIFIKEFVRWVRGTRAFGLDISDKALAKSANNVTSCRFLVADGQFIPFGNKKFDYVTCLGSLEHYLDPELGIREICRVAKDDARFCIVLPNSLGIDLFLHLVKNGEKPLDDFQIIEKTATIKEWISLLDKNGLAVDKVYSSNLWPEFFKEGTLRVKSIGKYFRRLVIKKFCPLNLAREFVFICKKKI